MPFSIFLPDLLAPLRPSKKLNMGLVQTNMGGCAEGLLVHGNSVSLVYSLLWLVVRNGHLLFVGSRKCGPIMDVTCDALILPRWIKRQAHWVVWSKVYVLGIVNFLASSYKPPLLSEARASPIDYIKTHALRKVQMRWTTN